MSDERVERVAREPAPEDGKGTVARKGDEGEVRPSGRVVPDEAVGGLMEGIER